MSLKIRWILDLQKIVGIGQTFRFELCHIPIKNENTAQTFWGSHTEPDKVSAGQPWCTVLPLSGPRSLRRQKTITVTNNQTLSVS